MREGVQALNCRVGGKFRLKDDAPLQMRRQKAVARDAELLRQVGMYGAIGSMPVIVRHRRAGEGS